MFEDLLKRIPEGAHLQNLSFLHHRDPATDTIKPSVHPWRCSIHDIRRCLYGVGRGDTPAFALEAALNDFGASKEVRRPLLDTDELIQLL